MTRRILFLGCSNLVDDNQNPNKEQIWKDVIFGQDVDIINLSWWGVGNQFIAGNCQDFLESRNVDYVYAQFTGLARFDMPVHEDFSIPDYDYAIKTYKRKYLCSGGKVGSWLGNDKTNEIFMPLYFKDEQYEHVAKESIQAVANTINFLDTKNIAYNWTFFYDITNPATSDEENYDGKINEFPKTLNKKNWISKDPHTFCFENKGLQVDQCHFDNNVYKQWLISVKDQIKYVQTN